jgi:hypothetical protein
MLSILRLRAYIRDFLFLNIGQLGVLASLSQFGRIINVGFGCVPESSEYDSTLVVISWTRPHFNSFVLPDKWALLQSGPISKCKRSSQKITFVGVLIKF